MMTFSGIARVYNMRPVLRGVDLSLAPGDFVALFGPNGAGKTTMMRIAATLLRATAGDVAVGGYSVRNNAAAVRGLIGVVSHYTLIYNELTAAENLSFYANAYGLERSRVADRVREVLGQVGLAKRAGDPVRTFSRGMQQRLAIARAILHDPPVLLLDEPHTGLDRQAAEVLARLLNQVGGRGRTVLMATHDVDRGLELSNRVAILARGRIVFDQPSAGLTIDSLARSYAELTAEGAQA